jgi:Lon protease-like protein
MRDGNDMTEQLPIFPLRTVLFPGALLPLHIFEPRYQLMLSRWADNEPCFGVVLTKSGSEVGDQPDTHQIGTSALNMELVTSPDGRSNLLVKGARHFEIIESDWDESYMMATITWLDAKETGQVDNDWNNAVGHIRNLLDRYLEAHNQASGQHATLRELDDQPVVLAYAVASTLPLPVETRQRLLEATPPDRLLATLEEVVRHETSLLAMTGALASADGHPGSRFTSN